MKDKNSPARSGNPDGTADLLLINAGTLHTFALLADSAPTGGTAARGTPAAPGSEGPRTGPDMRETGPILRGGLAVKEGRIIAADTTENLLARFPNPEMVLDAGGRLVLPGFVDCHTHTVFAGTRTEEFSRRLAGATYMEILESGGGIHSTVRATRSASEDDLVSSGLRRLSLMAAHGTTTVEIKSGYGLDLETERKMLSAAKRMGETGPCGVVTTYLGAHTIPKEMDREVYVDFIIREALPALKPLADFCDVFCEKGAFTPEESERILRRARDLGYGLKIHAGQFTALGSAGTAARLGAVSADHMEHVLDSELFDLAAAGTVTVLLPGASLFLLNDDYPDGRRFINAGVPVAVATDFNPGSCPCFSMQTALALSVLKAGLTAEEAVCGATINAAYACGLGSRVGSLKPGKDADFIILEAESLWDIPYHFGTNLVRETFRRGKRIASGSGQD